MTDKEARDTIQRAYDVTKLQAENSTGYLQLFYLGKMVGLQEAIIYMMDDPDFTLSVMGHQHDMIQSVHKMQAAFDKFMKKVENLGYDNEE